MKKLTRKKILVLGPALAQWSEIDAIELSLKFLTSCYQLDFVDPLRDVTELSNHQEFFLGWHNKMENIEQHYDAIFGFSLGGVVLQHCFDIFELKDKPIVLFSVPSFPDELLKERLSFVIDLIKDKYIDRALYELNRYVFYPHNAPAKLDICNFDQAALRISKGLQFVLDADSRPLLQKSHVKYLHLVGEESQLVNSNNIIASPRCQLAIVPCAGMRLLQSNSDACIVSVNKFLEEYI